MIVRFVLVFFQVFCTVLALAQTDQKAREALLFLSMFLFGTYLGSIAYDRTRKEAEREIR